jgi:hypothetical protein
MDSGTDATPDRLPAREVRRVCNCGWLLAPCGWIESRCPYPDGSLDQLQWISATRIMADMAERDYERARQNSGSASAGGSSDGSAPQPKA